MSEEPAGRPRAGSAARPRVTPAQRGRQAINGIIERVGMINRIHAALRSTLKIDDIHSIILTNLISRSALDFSRAILLSYDESRGMFYVRAALGAPSRAAHLRLQKEVQAEEAYLADVVTDLRNEHAGDAHVGGEETLFGQSLREASSHSFWITTYQKFSADSSLMDSLKEVEIVCDETQGRRSAPQRGGCTFMQRILKSENAKLLTAEDLAGSDLPPALLAQFTGPTVWASIKTQRGIKLVIVADRMHDKHPIEAIDLLHVDWFVGQVSLALDNAEMFKANEVAYLELQELDRLKSNFLSTVSHELRTPLTAITGYVQLLLGNRIGEITTGQKEVLERIMAHSDLLVGKVNDLIEIAEMDSGRASHPSIETIDPLHVLMTTLPRLDGSRAKKMISIEPIVTGTIPSVRANAAALGRIYFHLLDNAIKFSHRNGRVLVRFVAKDDELHIRVEDNGIGISPDQIKTIFHVFYQVDNQLTRSYEGLGIGLTIIKKFLNATGGRIEVSSDPGRGSAFTVVYPIA